jgi:hypothetical protein
MPKTKKHVPARHTAVGHYNMHYPDTSRAGFILPPDTHVEALFWVSNDGEKAYLCHMPAGKIVVWIKNTDDIEE